MSRTINQSKMFDYLGIGTVDLRYTPDLMPNIKPLEKLESLQQPSSDNIYNNGITNSTSIDLISLMIKYMYNVILIQFLVIFSLCGIIGFSCIKLIKS